MQIKTWQKSKLTSESPQEHVSGTQTGAERDEKSGERSGAVSESWKRSRKAERGAMSGLNLWLMPRSNPTISCQYN